MGIRKLDFQTPEYVEELPEFYLRELSKLTKHYSLEALGGHVCKRNTDYFERIACGLEPNLGVLLATDEDGDLEGVLESSTHIDGNLVIGDILWVLAKTKGEGIGSELIRQYKKEATQNGCDIMALTVTKTNIRAIKLYENLEFKYVRDRDENSKIYARGLTDKGLEAVG